MKSTEWLVLEKNSLLPNKKLPEKNKVASQIFENYVLVTVHKRTHEVHQTGKSLIHIEDNRCPQS